jgi:hypothetical protein
MHIEEPDVFTEYAKILKQLSAYYKKTEFARIIPSDKKECFDISAGTVRILGPCLPSSKYFLSIPLISSDTSCNGPFGKAFGRAALLWTIGSEVKLPAPSRGAT